MTAISEIMRKYFGKPYRWAVTFSVLLSLFTAFVLLHMFVIPQAQAVVQEKPLPTAVITAESTITASSYYTEGVSIEITTLRRKDTTVYLADIQLADASLLRTALADNTFGRNIKQRTSEIAAQNQAVFAINGDYYGFRDSGYVVRNGVIYRDTAGGSDAELLLIDMEGDFSILRDGQTALSELDPASLWQVFSFGPALIEDGEISVNEETEVDQSMRTNPRTAIGQIGTLHYLAVVSDGRTKASTGLSLYALAELFQEYGCQTAYNLDGGGSTTMVFNGAVINQPTTNGKRIEERSVSDVIYVAF